MALRRTLSKRLLDSYRANTSHSVALEHTPLLLQSPITVLPPHAAIISFHREYRTPSYSADKSFFRRILQRRAIYQTPDALPELRSLPVGDKLRETLRRINIPGDRLRLDGLVPPPPPTVSVDSLFGITVDDARKVLRFSRVERLKSKLREISKSSISYSEFIRICDEACENQNLGGGAELAKILDESGNVIVFGNIVFLRPEQVARSMETVISNSIAIPDDPRIEELKQMEKKKEMIDEKARALVRGELYCGMGFLIAQTLGFMRLTFWELTWDVMEPICFFVTSLHFALGYGFFLRTSTEPTLEGFFQRRFKTKQKKLMAVHNFDINRYNELLKACSLCQSSLNTSQYFSSTHI